jgi:hypothetical protein
LLDKTQINTIKLSQLLVGSKKDFIFSVDIDINKINLRRSENNIVDIVEAVCSMESVTGNK